ncbi:uncharacterized protein LOC118213600 [Anguilla anguilla]|uniref:uncharacterized protein LOC118213600 n=1 Tax=Anguilla anguilla TaxID=7936 RepID=UPI0015AC6B4F|nr:uncharacterized protein LOC118213600 [Anguilla anguilla]
MLKGIFASLICIYIQVPVQSQTENALSSEVSAYEASILALLVLLSLFSIGTFTVVFIVCRKIDKIWRDLSEKEVPCDYVNHHARLGASALPSPLWEEGETARADSQAPTRPSSLSLASNQNQESFRSPATPSTGRSTLRMKPPPDYEDTMSRLARQSRALRSLSLDGPVRAANASRDDSQSHYVEMKSCIISAFSTNQGPESMYDTPRNSHGILRRASAAQTPPSLMGSKHFRIHSDPSGYTARVVHPKMAAHQPREHHCSRAGFSSQPLSPGENGRSNSITLAETIPSGHKRKSTVRSHKQPPVDI